MERRHRRDLSNVYYSCWKYLLQKAREIEMITGCISILQLLQLEKGVRKRAIIQRGMNQSHIHSNHHLKIQCLTHQQMWWYIKHQVRKKKVKIKYTQRTYAACAAFYARLKKTKIAIHSGLGVPDNARKNVITDVTGGCTIGALIFTTKIVTKTNLEKWAEKHFLCPKKKCLHQLRWHGMKKCKKMWF